MDKLKAYQQGDVVLIARAAVPKGAKAVGAGARGYVLAEGEHTGHAHTVEAVPEVELYEKDGTLWLKVAGEGATVTHQEHAAQTVAPGVYEVRRVVEVDPFENEVRAVQD